jgi:hypothetical protein
VYNCYKCTWYTSASMLLVQTVRQKNSSSPAMLRTQPAHQQELFQLL